MKTYLLAAATVTLMAIPAMASPIALSSVDNPQTRIANANVRDTNGQIVGAVQRVELTPQGRPASVSIAMKGSDEKMITLDAAKVQYDATRNEVITNSSRKQLHMFYGQN